MAVNKKYETKHLVNCHV